MKKILIAFVLVACGGSPEERQADIGCAARMTGSYRFVYSVRPGTSTNRLAETVGVFGGERTDFVPCTVTVGVGSVLSSTCKPPAFGEPTDTAAFFRNDSLDGKKISGWLTIQTSSWNLVGTLQ